jgi:hypothetical protein
VPAINLAENLSTFSEHWQPRVIGQFNGHDVMVVIKGEFVWHQHDDTDDFFSSSRAISRFACMTEMSR